MESHAAARVRGSLPLRGAWLLFGLFLFALGIVLLLGSELGLAPWDVLNQGIEDKTPLSFGNANIAVAVLVMATAAGLGSGIGPGTVANAVLVGVFVDLLVAAGLSEAISGLSLVLRGVFVVLGIGSVAVGSALYIGAGMGAGPRDSLMLVLARRSGRRIGLVRAAIESSVTVVGFALGGTVGIGTLAFAFGIGPAVEASFSLLARSPLAQPASAPRVDITFGNPAE